MTMADIAMSAATARLDPIYEKFSTQQEAESYERWFRAKVQEALDDPRPAIPHDEAMRILDANLERKRLARASA